MRETPTHGGSTWLVEWAAHKRDIFAVRLDDLIRTTAESPPGIGTAALDGLKKGGR